MFMLPFLNVNFKIMKRKQFPTSKYRRFLYIFNNLFWPNKLVNKYTERTSVRCRNRTSLYSRRVKKHILIQNNKGLICLFWKTTHTFLQIKVTWLLHCSTPIKWVTHGRILFSRKLLQQKLIKLMDSNFSQRWNSTRDWNCLSLTDFIVKQNQTQLIQWSCLVAITQQKRGWSGNCWQSLRSRTSRFGESSF